MRIAEEELAARRSAFAATLAERGLDGAVLFDPQYVHYYTGFFFIPTERPIAFALASDGRGGMLVPRLELEHAQANTAVQEISHYDEYPGERHPVEGLRELLDTLGVRGRLGADHDGYPWIFGYRGPPLGEWTHIAADVEDQMAIKSPAEIELLRESCKWANLAHTLLQRYTRVGITETEVETRASHEATHAMLDAIGPIYRAQSPYYDGATAGYRGQIGRNAAIPHAHGNNIIFQAGDVLVTGASAPVWGYHSELERTMVIGAPSDEQRRMFDHMVALQDLAVDTILPGVPCAAVDSAVRAYYEKHDLWECWRHHVGHAIGMRYHEGPFLDRGDATEIRPGMVFTVEPGLYAPQLGGFRHSDTIAVTETGVEWLTYYPRDIESLTLPA
ncbi:MAG TPA: Xaa-Pro peptidase family protein [Gaiellaceae bacterium]|jgi:Xaa-Pro aminopeptidase|nr:Xaa-Pro peptidase family protein [Gaiellaceae bacterium]